MIKSLGENNFNGKPFELSEQSREKWAYTVYKIQILCFMDSFIIECVILTIFRHLFPVSKVCKNKKTKLIHIFSEKKRKTNEVTHFKLIPSL